MIRKVRVAQRLLESDWPYGGKQDLIAELFRKDPDTEDSAR